MNSRALLQNKCLLAIPDVPVPPGICHLVGPGGGEFIRKPLSRGGPFVNSSRSGLHCSFFFQYFTLKYAYLDTSGL